MSWVAPRYDVIVAGGGPAGLAAAIAVARAGFEAVILEKRSAPWDKACGEGVLPPGVRLLDDMGVCELLDPDGFCRLDGIRYAQEDGVAVEAQFASPGMGIRRRALTAALTARALALGVTLVSDCRVSDYTVSNDRVAAQTSQGPVEARLLVAADGLDSPLRHAAGLDGPVARLRRFGARRHFALSPWSSLVEVHWAAGCEAYVTPVGPERIGIAFLWEPGRLGHATYCELLARFPVLAERLSNALPDSSVRGAGPLARRVERIVGTRLILLGDAAGYCDAITGEGLSLAFAGAAHLGAELPAILAHGVTLRSLHAYQRAYLALYRRYAFFARLLVAISRRPWLRSALLGSLAAQPDLFGQLVRWAMVEG